MQEHESCVSETPYDTHLIAEEFGSLCVVWVYVLDLSSEEPVKSVIVSSVREPGRTSKEAASSGAQDAQSDDRNQALSGGRLETTRWYAQEPYGSE